MHKVNDYISGIYKIVSDSLDPEQFIYPENASFIASSDHR